MSREYITLSKNIIKHLGGQNNINNVYHCQTRLRFSLNDPTKVNLEQLKTLKEVKTVVISGGQHQIVIGTHVAKVFEEINSLIETNSTTKIEQTKKAKAVSRIIDFVSGTFQPILPALSGAGMISFITSIQNLDTVISNIYITKSFCRWCFLFFTYLNRHHSCSKIES